MRVKVGERYGFQRAGEVHGGWRHGVVRAVELAFVLVEWEGERDQWDEPLCQWVPAGVWDETYQRVTAVVVRRVAAGG